MIGIVNDNPNGLLFKYGDTVWTIDSNIVRYGKITKITIAANSIVYELGETRVNRQQDKVFSSKQALLDSL